MTFQLTEREREAEIVAHFVDSRGLARYVRFDWERGARAEARACAAAAVESARKAAVFGFAHISDAAINAAASALAVVDGTPF